MKENNSNNLLDILNITSFIAQLDNISKDEKQTIYIQKVIQAIAKEIEDLHIENDKIIKQNEEILKILKGGNVN